MATKFRFKNADGTTLDFEDYYVRADYFRSGNLWLWGGGAAGQLGNNQQIVGISSPVQTIAWGSNWKSVSCQHVHTAAIKTDGTLWTWGNNSYGQLGDNTVTIKSSPVQTIAFGTNWKQVASGYARTVAIKTDGTLWSWGYNTDGSLGDNTSTRRSSPVQTIARGNNWKQVASEYTTSAAIKTDGTLWCWGTNGSGQLGDNTVTKRSSPVQTVAGGTNWMQVSCGISHTAAIKTDGTLWTWGYNANGQLGDNTNVDKSSPVQTVVFGTSWKMVACGYNHTIATKTDGTLWCWGHNSYGQLGENTLTHRSSPVQTISYGTNWKQVSAMFYQTAAVKTDGTLWTWGVNDNGQLGDNTASRRSSPVQTVAGGTNWKEVSIGQNFMAAIQYQDDYQ